MASKNLGPDASHQITKFILFNYDNLIADYYEPQKPYLSQLAVLLSQDTGIPTQNILEILTNEALSKYPHPIQYLKHVDEKIETSTGYYFVSK